MTDLSDILPKKGEIWEHTKSGDLYQVEGSTFNSITDRVDVSYVPLYPCEFSRFNRQMRGHPKAWLSSNEDGSPRFKKVGSDDPRLPLE